MPESGTYRFIGKDRSLGYRTGQTYDLVVRRDQYGAVFIKRPETPIGVCPYSSEAAFWRNWEKVGSDTSREDG